MDFASDGKAVPEKDPWGAQIDAVAAAGHPGAQ